MSENLIIPSDASLTQATPARKELMTWGLYQLQCDTNVLIWTGVPSEMGNSGLIPNLGRGFVRW